MEVGRERQEVEKEVEKQDRSLLENRKEKVWGKAPGSPHRLLTQATSETYQESEFEGIKISYVSWQRRSTSLGFKSRFNDQFKTPTGQGAHSDKWGRWILIDLKSKTLTRRAEIMELVCACESKSGSTPDDSLCLKLVGPLTLPKQFPLCPVKHCLRHLCCQTVR